MLIQNITEKLRSWVTAAPESQPNIPPTLHVSLPEMDEEYQEDGHWAFEEFIGMSVGIHYVDSKGKESERRIRIHTLCEQPDGDILMKCHCYERNASRSFKLSRIRQIIDLQTGEIFEEPTRFNG
ncbi:MAG: hypothetical protein CMM94_07015 [Rickettsiales bacterium]|nr:hypothetical protein [Rickettsiales bacterium]